MEETENSTDTAESKDAKKKENRKKYASKQHKPKAKYYPSKAFLEEVLPHIEILVAMRANGATMGALASYCGLQFSYFNNIINQHPDIKQRLERAYQANLDKVRETLFSLAVGGKVKRTLITNKDANGNLINTQTRAEEIPPNFDAIRAVLTMAGEMGDSQQNTINIDTKVLAEQAEKFTQDFKLEIKTPMISTNPWRISNGNESESKSESQPDNNTNGAVVDI